MEILELKNTITEIKSSMDRLNRRMKGTEERFSELEDRKWKLPNRGKIDEKTKMNRASGTSGTLTKDLTFVSSLSGKERRKRLG